MDETLAINPGQQSNLCTEVSIIDDNILESAERFSISITTDLPGIILGDIEEATITIMDNDG